MVRGAAFITEAAGVALLALVAAVPLATQGRTGGGPRYDPATEATITGTVEAVEHMADGRGRGGPGGTHLTFKTGSDTLDVHLGPTAYLDAQKVAIQKGDTLEITGSRVTVDDKPVFLAKQVRKGDTTWTLRDPAGLPLWRGRGAGQ